MQQEAREPQSSGVTLSWRGVSVHVRGAHTDPNDRHPRARRYGSTNPAFVTDGQTQDQVAVNLPQKPSNGLKEILSDGESPQFLPLH